VTFVPICLLIRHGRTTANASGTLAGWTPGIGLDETGLLQAGSLAGRLRALPVVRVVSSPLQRCLETAQTLVDALDGVRVELQDALGECRYGAWTGGQLTELAKEPLWRTVQDQPSAARFPDGEEFPGESIGQMQHRAVQAVRSIDAEVERSHGVDAIWVLVSHGDVIKSVLADAAGTHLDHFQRIVVDPASLSVVRYTSRRPFVLRVNDGGADLSGLAPPPRTDTGADGAGTAHDGPDPVGDAPVGGGAGSAG
jgi:probable phosphomutase (TIGR03848 family)